MFFLVGQCCVAFLQRWPETAFQPQILVLIPACLLRGGSRLAFALGCIWQIHWMPLESRLCHPFFWFLCAADPAADPIPQIFQGTRLDQIAEDFATTARNFFLNWDPEFGAWYLRFAFGLPVDTGTDWTGIYQDLGLLHVLVVSGAHFSFLGLLGQALVEGPGRIAYALRLCSFSVWLGWTTAARIFLTVIITLFALLVGFNPPCQRSWISLLLRLWLPIIGVPTSDATQDRLVFAMQAFCFPASFLSLSNALSWSAYTLVRRLSSWPRLWQRWLLPAVEGPLIAVNLSYFGSFSPWGMVLNTLLQPVWHLILAWGLLIFLWPNPWLSETLLKVLQGLHDGIRYVWQEGQQNGSLQWNGQGILWNLGRSLLWCVASWTFFSLWRNLNAGRKAP